MSSKCQAKGGPAECTSPNCPEKRAFLATLDTFVPKPVLVPAKPATFVGAWTEEDTILFRTPSGSSLYGLNHSKSDDDYYVITPTRKTAKMLRQDYAKHSIVDGIDTVTVDFATFVGMAEKGAPQALEAMFSRKATSPFFEDYRQGFYASDPRVIKSYMRTIRRFSLSAPNDFKPRRHALRLAHNLKELLYTGRFNPTLSRSVAKSITKAAVKTDKQYFEALRSESIIEVDWNENDRGREFEKEYLAAQRAKEEEAWAAYLARTGQTS